MTSIFQHLTVLKLRLFFHRSHQVAIPIFFSQPEAGVAGQTLLTLWQWHPWDYRAGALVLSAHITSPVPLLPNVCKQFDVVYLEALLISHLPWD